MPAASSHPRSAAKRKKRLKRYVARVVSNDIYFHPGVYDRLRQQPGALDAVTKTLAGHEGINRVLRREELANPDASNDPIVRAAALSYVAGRSGDLILATKPGWMFSVEGFSATTGIGSLPVQGLER